MFRIPVLPIAVCSIPIHWLLLVAAARPLRAQESSPEDLRLRFLFAAVNNKVKETSHSLPVISVKAQADGVVERQSSTPQPAIHPRKLGDQAGDIEAFAVAHDREIACVRQDQFRKKVADITTQLLAGLEKPELAGMRSYVLEATKSLPDPIVGDYVSESSARSILGALEFVTCRLAKLDRLRLDLEIVTKPSGASFRILPYGGGVTFDRTTNTVVTNLYRGYYRYEITKIKHKPVQGIANLVDERGSKLMCELVPATSEEPASPCRLVE